MASKFRPAGSRALENALRACRTAPVPTCPALAQQAVAERQFSTTTQRPSKLGRTPITIPTGVELSLSDLKRTKIATSYKPVVTRTITVAGPLGRLQRRQSPTTITGDHLLSPHPMVFPPSILGHLGGHMTREKTPLTETATGTLNLDVPAFVRLQQDAQNKTALLSVEDANIRQQREMWGTFHVFPFACFGFRFSSCTKREGFF